MITENDIKKVLNYPNRDILSFLLELVILSPRERLIIHENYFLDNTEDEISEKLFISKSTVQRIKKKAIRKCLKCWENNKIVENILNQ